MSLSSAPDLAAWMQMRVGVASEVREPQTAAEGRTVAQDRRKPQKAAEADISTVSHGWCVCVLGRGRTCPPRERVASCSIPTSPSSFASASRAVSCSTRYSSRHRTTSEAAGQDRWCCEEIRGDTGGALGGTHLLLIECAHILKVCARLVGESKGRRHEGVQPE